MIIIENGGRSIRSIHNGSCLLAYSDRLTPKLRSLLQEILSFQDLEVQFAVKHIALEFFPISTKQREARTYYM